MLEKSICKSSIFSNIKVCKPANLVQTNSFIKDFDHSDQTEKQLFADVLEKRVGVSF